MLHDSKRRFLGLSLAHKLTVLSTVTSAVYVDYLQLVRDGDEWKILNVLWAKA